MSFSNMFNFVEVGERPANPWWLEFLRSDTDPLVSFSAFRKAIIARIRRIDDACVTTTLAFLDAWSSFYSLPRPRLFVHRRSGSMMVGSMDAEFFRIVTGRSPSDDELHRVNCEHEGTIGHATCGWCPHCERPRFACGHVRFDPGA